MTRCGALLVDTAQMAWRLNSLSVLHWRRWGEDWVVFDAASGMTHRLDTLGATTLLMLQEFDADIAQLENQLAEELQIDNRAALRPMLETVLRRLQGADLIQPDIG